MQASQVQGRGLWVGATVMVRNGCRTAVPGDLQSLGLDWHAFYPYLR